MIKDYRKVGPRKQPLVLFLILEIENFRMQLQHGTLLRKKTSRILSHQPLMTVETIDRTCNIVARAIGSIESNSSWSLPVGVAQRPKWRLIQGRWPISLARYIADQRFKHNVT